MQLATETFALMLDSKSAKILLFHLPIVLKHAVLFHFVLNCVFLKCKGFGDNTSPLFGHNFFWVAAAHNPVALWSFSGFMEPVCELGSIHALKSCSYNC